MQVFSRYVTKVLVFAHSSDLVMDFRCIGVYIYISKHTSTARASAIVIVGATII